MLIDDGSSIGAFDEKSKQYKMMLFTTSNESVAISYSSGNVEY